MFVPERTHLHPQRQRGNTRIIQYQQSRGSIFASR